MNPTLVHLLIGILAVAAHSLMKYNDLKNKAVAGNVVFTFNTYLSQDWVSIGLSFIAVGLWLLLFKDVAAKYPQLTAYENFSFAAMGFMGSYIIQYVGSTAQKKITAIIDAKTTALDGTTKAKTDINTKTVTTLPEGK